LLVSGKRRFILELIVGKFSEVSVALEEAFTNSLPKTGNKKSSEADWAAALDRFNAEARAIRERYRLGVIGRAVSAHRLQRRLLAAGFPSDMVRHVVFSMVLNAFIR
jgi:hypothetical protein